MESKIPFHSSTWQWMRVYYFDDCKDDLILDAIRPALDRMAVGNAGEAYFERDWIGGPNVLVGILSALEGEHRERALQPIRDYLVKYPSRACLETSQFRRQNEISAALEWRRPADVARSLAANNMLVLNCEEPFSPVLEPGPLQEAVRHFLCRSSGLVINWLELVRRGQWSRQLIAMHAMIALAWVANPQTLRSHISFSSHAYGFLRFMDRRSNVHWEEKFARHYANGEGEATRRLVSDSLDTLQRHDHPLPGMNEYVFLVRETMSSVYAGLVDGRYHAPAVQEITTNDVVRSDAQTQINHRTRMLMEMSMELQTWRIVVNLVYLMLNQLGLPALERYLACYLITRAAEEIFHESATGIVQGLADTGDVGQVISFFVENNKVPANHCQSTLMRR